MPSTTPPAAPGPAASHLTDLLTEMLHGFRRPAALLDPKDEVLYLTPTAEIALDPEGTGAERSPREWNQRITFQAANGQACSLAVPGMAPADKAGASHLPPRLAKIAGLVVSGCTDKQIASRTGLSFSTVRTYVRQIFRRAGVHSRVELVHATRAGFGG